MSVIPPEVADSRRAPTTTALGSADSADKAPGWGKTDTIWTLSLFGTAIGAGVIAKPVPQDAVEQCLTYALARRAGTRAVTPIGMMAFD